LSPVHLDREPMNRIFRIGITPPAVLEEETALEVCGTSRGVQGCRNCRPEIGGLRHLEPWIRFVELKGLSIARTGTPLRILMFSRYPHSVFPPGISRPGNRTTIPELPFSIPGQIAVDPGPFMEYQDSNPHTTHRRPRTLISCLPKMINTTVQRFCQGPRVHPKGASH